MEVARVVSPAGNYALMPAGRRFTRRGIRPEDRPSRESHRPTQRCSANLPRGHRILAGYIESREIATRYPHRQSNRVRKGHLACDSCNVWRVIENPQFAFHVLVAGMFRAVGCRRFRH